MQEFRRYAHYMQPRIHKMIAEARPSSPCVHFSRGHDIAS